MTTAHLLLSALAILILTIAGAGIAGWIYSAWACGKELDEEDAP